MEVRIRFFASYRDLLGTDHAEVELPDPASVTDLVRSLRARGAPFDRLPSDPAVAVNQRYAGPETPVVAGDEVAFIPPVAGG